MGKPKGENKKEKDVDNFFLCLSSSGRILIRVKVSGELADGMLRG